MDIATIDTCGTCNVTGIDTMTYALYLINGSNETACHWHAMALEESHPDSTFAPVTPALARYLVAA